MHRRALITGATGLLGSWLTCELLKKYSFDKVFLLVRSKSNTPAKKRIKNVIGIIPHRLSKKSLQKIEIIDGDISKINLGLSRQECCKFMDGVTDIFHSAARAEFGLSLKRVRPINVSGTKNLLECAQYASRHRVNEPIHFHHISTIAVAGDRKGSFDETDFYEGQDFNNSYERSKYEAELQVRKYRKKNLILKIYRPAIITGDSQFGITTNFKMIYQPLHFLAHNLFTILPADAKSLHSLVPVDKVAKAISILSNYKDSENRVYHLVNPHEMSLELFINTGSEVFGYKKPKLIPIDKFPKSHLSPAQWKLIDPFVPYLNYKLRFKSSRGNKLLRQNGFQWPVVDKRFLKTLFKYCLDANFKAVSI